MDRNAVYKAMILRATIKDLLEEQAKLEREIKRLTELLKEVENNE